MNTNYLSLVKLLLVVVVSLTVSNTTNANNIQVSNVAIVGQNTTSQFSMVRFDVSWDNSWRTSTLESNWDAAWVFVKIRNLNSNIWQHARLHNTGHFAPAGSVLDVGLVNTGAAFDPVTNYGAGVFLYRDADGHGSVNYNQVELRWNYGANGLQDNDSVQVCVYAIEMVYAPEGAFFVGDAEATTSNRLKDGNTPNPFQITSEALLNVNDNPGELWAEGTVSNTGSIVSGALPLVYPKGFQAFYTMKYEISQGIYKEFLNKLTRTQQDARFAATAVGRYMHSGTTQTTPANRNGVRLIDDPGGASPRVYANDLNNNGVYNESDDGEFIGCNWMSYRDVSAFADWTGLRPMSELEYEKLARGTLSPVSGELAWGNNTDVYPATTIINNGQSTEAAGNNPANFNGLNSASVGGPMRVGCFASSATNRVESGGGYYGAMDLSGGVDEFYISVNRGSTNATIDNRNMDGRVHGDGVLAANGEQDQGWPTTSYMRRGSDWSNTNVTIFAISARDNISGLTTQRNNSYGGRLGRTAP